VVVSFFYVLASCLGIIIGTSELVSRYRDAPFRTLVTIPALLYVALNGVASFAALVLVREFGWLQQPSGPDDVKTLLTQSLAAGLSAMALFRTSLFMIRVANTDIGIGPAAFLQILLSAADRACDRTRAKPRAAAVQEIMRGISFQRSKQALPSLCFGLMQNVSGEEQRIFGTVVTQLEASQMDDVFKANSLGLALMNVVGEGVLRQAVNMLRDDIAAPPRPIVQSISTLRLVKSVVFAQSSAQILDSCLFMSNRMSDDALDRKLRQALDKISAMSLPDSRKVLLLSVVLIGTFGEDTVQAVLRSLPENDTSSSPTPVANEKVVDLAGKKVAAEQRIQAAATEEAHQAAGNGGQTDPTQIGLGAPAQFRQS
jgi:hypothetical protein